MGEKSTKTGTFSEIIGSKPNIFTPLWFQLHRMKRPWLGQILSGSDELTVQRCDTGESCVCVFCLKPLTVPSWKKIKLYIWLMPWALTQPHLAHLRLGATRAPRWLEEPKQGASGDGRRSRSERVCHGWAIRLCRVTQREDINTCTDGVSGLEGVYKKKTGQDQKFLEPGCIYFKHVTISALKAAGVPLR